MALSDPAITVLLCMAAYLGGSVLFALPVCRLWALPDPRAQGSGNPGATNVYRTGGWLPALITLALDAAKGWLPVWLAYNAGLSPLVQAIVALCAVTGHMVPVFYRFKGGKGVATNAGVAFGLAWEVGAAYALVWIAVLVIVRISSVAGMSAVVAATVAAALLGLDQFVPVLIFIALLIIWLHRANVSRLLKGEEPRVGKAS